MALLNTVWVHPAKAWSVKAEALLSQLFTIIIVLSHTARLENLFYLPFFCSDPKLFRKSKG